jgi:hypothetical protein
MGGDWKGRGPAASLEAFLDALEERREMLGS